jgi:periplasmic divalent cation tolerance protein
VLADMKKSNCCVIHCSCPDKKSAEKVAGVLLEHKVAACVNTIPSVVSSYWWKGKIETSSEYLLIIKTQSKFFKLIEGIIQSVHPYEVPEIIELPIVRGHAGYLEWIDESVKEEKKTRG